MLTLAKVAAYPLIGVAAIWMGGVGLWWRRAFPSLCGVAALAVAFALLGDVGMTRVQLVLCAYLIGLAVTGVALWVSTRISRVT